MRAGQTRTGVAASCGSLLAVAAGAAAAPTQPINPGTISVTLERIATIPAADNGTDFLTFAPGDPTRMFVNGRGGEIEEIKNGVLQPTPFLNLVGSTASGGAGLPVINTGGADERGLLGLAFSPGYNNPASPGFGKFYTYESETTNTSVPANSVFTHPEITTPSYQNVVREWTVNPSNPDSAVAGTSRELFRINKLQSNHNGGTIRFGPDGDLYIGTGDGGGANDSSGGITNNADGHTNNTGNGQDTTVVYGKILRIDPNTSDPNTTLSADGKYAIPNSNPFANSTTGQAKEIYAYGMRNPWRISFGPDGTLYAADVGQAQREEIDKITSGGNYGWPYNEGSLQNSTYAAVRPAGFTDVQPIAEYTHSDGIAVIGGFVYTGTAIPALTGKYVFGDYQGNGHGPRLFYMDANGGTISEFLYDAAGVQLASSGSLFGIGQDAFGNLYATMSNGDVLELVPEPTTAAGVGVVGCAALLKRRRRAV